MIFITATMSYDDETIEENVCKWDGDPQKWNTELEIIGKMKDFISQNERITFEMAFENYFEKFDIIPDQYSDFIYTSIEQ